MEEMEPTCQSTPRVPFKKLQTNISSGLTPNAKRLNLNQSFKDFETIQLNKGKNIYNTSANNTYDGIFKDKL
jgi:hypothetical protein